MQQLPKTVLDVVQLIEVIHPERIAFTERAKKSASDSRFDDVHRAWKALWAMATVLYDLFCERNGNDMETVFQDQTGFELAMTEGKLTKKNLKLMSQRNDTFMGQEIDIAPHVKLDADSTRAYFSPFNQNGTKRIVVGYIGHLTTAGTRRRGK